MKKTLTILLLVIISLSACVEKSKYTSFEIVSLRGEVQVEGSFFLGCGSIGGEEYLMTFRKRLDGGFERLRVLMDRSVIYEDSDEFPYVEVQVNCKCGHRNWYKFHVPEGTIIKEFKLK